MGMKRLHTAGAWLLSFVTVITIVIPPSKFSHGALELVTKPEHTLVEGKRRDFSVLGLGGLAKSLLCHTSAV